MSSWNTDRRTQLVTLRLRLPMAVVAVLAAVTVTALGWHFAGQTHAGPLDSAIGSDVTMRHGAARVLGQGFADLGNPLPVAGALVVLAVVAYLARGPRGLTLALAGPLLAMITTSLVLKPLVDRTRSGGLAFPSGHTTAVGSMAVAAGILLLGWGGVPRALRWAGAGVLALLVIAVGASMVGRGYHYPSDTVGGVGVALAVVTAVALTVDRLGDRLGDRVAAAREGHVVAVRDDRRTIREPTAAPRGPRTPRPGP